MPSKKVQIPHTRAIIVGQKISTIDQKSLPWADVQRQIPLLCAASLLKRLNIDRYIINENFGKGFKIVHVITSCRSNRPVIKPVAV